MQIFHPISTEGYREAMRAIRKIGRECIMQRYKAIANKEEVPNDILTQIIEVARHDRHVDLEDLVDDFATFYIAGEGVFCAVNISLFFRCSKIFLNTNYTIIFL